MTAQAPLEISSPPAAPSKVWAIALLGVALLAVSFAAIFIRVSEADLGANATIFNRCLIFLLVFGPGQAIVRTRSTALDGDGEAEIPLPPPLTQQQGWLLLAVGFISTISLVLWAMSLNYTTVAKSVLLNNMTPIFTSLGGWLILGRRFDLRFLLGLIVAMVGAIALGLEDIQGEGGSLLGDAYALLSAAFLAAYFLIAEHLRSRFSATTILLCRCSIGCLVLLPITLVTEGQLFASSWSSWLAVIGLGLICEGMGQRLLAQSLSHLSSGFISLFLLLEPLVSALLAWWIFAEMLSPRSWVAFGVVLGGIYLAQTSDCAHHTPSGITVEPLQPEEEEDFEPC